MIQNSQEIALLLSWTIELHQYVILDLKKKIDQQILFNV